MSEFNSSKIKFSQLEVNILKKLGNKYQSPHHFKFKTLTNQFNIIGKQQIPDFKEKSLKAVQSKLKEIYNIQKHFWSQELGQIMLDSVANDQQWIQISRLPPFAQHKINCKEIKRKFQCGIRTKFKTLYREVFKKGTVPTISDLTFKVLLQQKQIQQFYQKGIIDENEKKCLKKNIQIFTTNIDSGENSTLGRSNEGKQLILSYRDPTTSIGYIVNTIIKLNKHIKDRDFVEEIMIEGQNFKTFSTKMKTKTTLDALDIEKEQQFSFEKKKIGQILYYEVNQMEQHEFISPEDQNDEFMNMEEEDDGF